MAILLPYMDRSSIVGITSKVIGAGYRKMHLLQLYYCPCECSLHEDLQIIKSRGKSGTGTWLLTEEIVHG